MVTKRDPLRWYSLSDYPYPDEEWRVVPGFETIEVSSYGRARKTLTLREAHHRPGFMLKTSVNEKGYVQLAISRHGKSKSIKLHKLVCLAWFGPRPVGLEIDHKDTDKLNNRPNNLEYVTPKENVRRAVSLGRIDFKRLNSIGRKAIISMPVRNKLSAVQVLEIRVRLSAGESRKDVAARFGLNRTTVGDIERREIWKDLLE